MKKPSLLTTLTRCQALQEKPKASSARPLRATEQNEILGIFMDMLAGPTGDGGVKRFAGTKPHWKVDDHFNRGMAHIERYVNDGERWDKDSGVNPLIHAAWRLLATAWQDDERDGAHTADEPA